MSPEKSRFKRWFYLLRGKYRFCSIIILFVESLRLRSHVILEVR